MSGSPWTSSYMGQTDPVSVFPSQQPFRKDPSGCSRVGCTGNGNPDDPVNIFTLPTTKSPKLLSQPGLKCCLPSQKISSPSNGNTQREKPLVSVTFFEFSENTVLLLLPTWKIVQCLSKLQICVRQYNVTLIVTSYWLLGMLKFDYSDSWHVIGSKRSEKCKHLVCLNFCVLTHSCVFNLITQCVT